MVLFDIRHATAVYQVGYLTDFLDALEKLSQEGCGHDAISTSPTSENIHDASWEQEVAMKQQALKRLHMALVCTNHHHYRISLQVTDDTKKFGSVFAKQQHHDPSNTDSVYHFALHRHLPSTDFGTAAAPDAGTPDPDTPDIGPSWVFVAQSAKSRSSESLPWYCRAQNLDQCPLFAASGPSADEFERWGGVHLSSPGDVSEADVHWLVRYRQRSWRSRGTLFEAFESGIFGEGMSVIQIISLALVITNTHLYLGWLKSICRPITLRSFRYYTSEDSEMPFDWFDTTSMVPYVDIGFGQMSPLAVQARTTSQNTYLNLGLSLAQIGLCVPYYYETSSVGEAQSLIQPWLDDDQSESPLPPDFYEIIRDCLLFDYQIRDIPGEAETKADTAFLIDKVRRLQHMKSQLVLL